MAVVDSLKKFAGKLGLIQVVTPTDPDGASAPSSVTPNRAPSEASSAPKVETRTISLDALVREVRQRELGVLAELPAELSVEYARVFEAAGIRSGPGAWTIERLKALLETSEYRSLDRNAAQARLLERFEREKITVEDLLRDTVARDVAIDAYAGFVKKKMDERITARQREIAELVERARALDLELRKLRDETKLDRTRFREWKAKKIEYERGMAWAIGFLLDRPVVSVDTPEPEDDRT